jgi:uncharacterized protein YgbK (DUF1537 family)
MSLTQGSLKHPNWSFTAFAMIADDLAGACDTSAEFLPRLGAVTVFIDSDNPVVPFDQSKTLVVWNTESRSLSEEAAYQKVRRACTHALQPETHILLKKADSAFRGHYGREIAAVMDAWPNAVTGLLPAIPTFGRVTRNGVQYLNGVPIAESFYRQDPKHPVKESRVAIMASKGNPRQITHLTLNMIRNPRNHQILNRLLQSGHRLIIADSETQDDLNRAVSLFVRQHTPLILVGGQGMGQAIAQHCLPLKSQETWAPIPHGPIVIVCGSLHPRTRQQLQTFSKTFNVEPVTILQNRTGFKLSPNAEQKVVGRLLDQISQSKVGVLTSPEHDVQDPVLVETVLADTIKTLDQQTPIRGLILTGGSTAYTVCRCLGVRQLQLRQRMGFGVIAAQAPELSGMVIGIKGGSLGERGAFINLVKFQQSLQS